MALKFDYISWEQYYLVLLYSTGGGGWASWAYLLAREADRRATISARWLAGWCDKCD